MTLINFLVINLLLLASSFIINFFISKQSKASPTHQVFSVLVLYLSLITTLLVGLGSLGILSYLSVSISSYLIFVSLALYSKGKYSFKRIFRLPNLNISLDSKLPILLFLPIGVLAAMKMFIAFFKVPVEYDALVYHLPIISQWLQTGSLMDIYYTAFAGPLAYYPSNFDLLYLWSTFAFKNDYLLNLLNFPILLSIPLIIYSICRNFKIEKSLSWIISAFPIYMPVFFQQLGTVFVDAYFALTLLFSLYFLQEINKNPYQINNSILFGLSLGLFVGTKYLGLPFSLFVLCIFFAIHFFKKVKTLKPFTFGLGSLVLTGSFFYIRNFLNSGNPIFPVDISILGRNVLEGYPNASQKLVDSALWDNLNSLSTIKEMISSFWIMTDLPGMLVFLSVLLGLLYVFYKKVFAKKNGKSIQDMAGLLVITTVFFLLYLKAPYSYRDLIHNIRYAMPFLILGTINLGYIINKFKKFRPLFYIIAIISFMHSLIYLVRSPDYKTFFNFWILDLYTEYFIMMLCGLLLILLSFYIKHKKTLSVSALILSSLLFCSILNFSFSKRDYHVRDFYEVYYPENNKLWGIWNTGLWIDENKPEAKIAYSGFHFHYPLIGGKFERSADYININECTKCRYVDFKRSKDSIRRDPNFEDWILNLSSSNIDYIVIDTTITPGVKSYEEEWVQSHPEDFQLVKKYNSTVIYKFLER